MRKIGLGFVFCFFVVGGSAHLLVPDLFVRIMPPYLPLHYPAVYLSGACELLGALGILLPATRQWAGNGLIALTVAVTPANIHMWLHAGEFPTFSPAVLGFRLWLQGALIALIWWATRRDEAFKNVEGK